MSRRRARRLARRRKPPDEGNPNPTPPAQPTPPTPPPAADPPAPTPPPAPAAPTQAQLDAAIAQALGMPVAEAKKVLKAQEDARKAAMTEAERIQAEAREAVEKAQRDAATATQTAHDARVQIALVRAGVHPDKLEWAARLVGAPTGADDKALADAITAAKAAVPEVFAGTSTGPVPPPAGGTPPPSNPPGSPPAPKPTPDLKAKAAALIAERYPNLAPKPGGST